jgi:hypothetical protein
LQTADLLLVVEESPLDGLEKIQEPRADLALVRRGGAQFRSCRNDAPLDIGDVNYFGDGSRPPAASASRRLLWPSELSAFVVSLTTCNACTSRNIRHVSL